MQCTAIMPLHSKCNNKLCIFVQLVQLYHLQTHWLTSIGPIFRLSLWFYEAPLPNNPLQSPTLKCNIQGLKLIHTYMNHTYINNIYENTLLNRINAEQPNLLSAKNNFSIFKISRCRRSAKDLIDSEDPKHTLFCREIAFVAIYALFQG